MKIAIGSDHAGWKAKEEVKSLLQQLKHTIEDFGTNNEDSVDYPDYALKVARAVTAGKFERGILICGTGLGMCLTANKVKGIRAVACHDEFTAEMSRLHNDANILCFGARVLGTEQIEAIVKIWLNTAFEGGRHQRRLDKISDSEK